MKSQTIRWLSKKHSKDEKVISILMKINEVDGETEEKSIELINAFFCKKYAIKYAIGEEK